VSSKGRRLKSGTRRFEHGRLQGGVHILGLQASISLMISALTEKIRDLLIPVTSITLAVDRRVRFSVKKHGSLIYIEYTTRSRCGAQFAVTLWDRVDDSKTFPSFSTKMSRDGNSQQDRCSSEE
jgi:hypothetical protein